MERRDRERRKRIDITRLTLADLRQTCRNFVKEVVESSLLLMQTKNTRINGTRWKTHIMR